MLVNAMTKQPFIPSRRPMVSSLVLAALLLPALPLAAQEATVAKRVEKLEKEMRAVQRTVFPGGAPTFFEGEIAPDAQPGVRAAASTPIADLTARVDALETQLRSVTEQSEQNAFKLRELEKQLAALKLDADKRLDALEAPAAAPATTTPAALPVTTAATPPAATPTAAATPPRAATPAAPTPAAAVPRPASPPPTAVKPSPQRLALVSAIPVPSTGNAVDDGYSYGYRLWEAKLYPEAQAQLKQVVAKYPKHRLASFAQNLLGRAYLDEGKPSLAARAFFDNYNDRPDGERAPHSLMYMGIALDKLGRKADACKAFRELEEVYGERAPKDVRTEAAAAKAKAGC
jgi:TolA-binding protein